MTDKCESVHERVLALARQRLQSYTSEQKTRLYARWLEEATSPRQKSTDTGLFLRRASALLGDSSQDRVGAVAVGRGRTPGSSSLVQPAAPEAQVGDVPPSLDAEDVSRSLGSAPLPADSGTGSVRQLRKSRLAALPSLSRLLPRQLRRRRQLVREAVEKSAPRDSRAQMAMLRDSLTPEQWQILRAMGKVFDSERLFTQWQNVYCMEIIQANPLLDRMVPYSLNKEFACNIS